MNYWYGRRDDSQPLRVHETVIMTEIENIPENNGIAFVGWASDEGIIKNLGRAGAKEGPNAFRQAFSNLPKLSYPFYDCGNFTEETELTQAVFKIASRRHLSFVVGGGHDLAKSHFFGLRKAYPNEKIAIINIDAHLDLRPGPSSSGTPFSEIQELEKDRFSYTCIGVQQLSNTEQLYKRAKELNVTVIFADTLHLQGFSSTQTTLQKLMNTHDLIYLTLCLDVFAAPFAPGVSAPQSLGLLPWQVIPILREIAACKKLAGFDIAEPSPPFDIDQRTAKLCGMLAGETFAHYRSLQNIS